MQKHSHRWHKKATEIQKLKFKVHRLMESRFGDWYVEENRKAMYQWLGKHTKTGHIATCTMVELQYIYKRLNQYHI